MIDKLEILVPENVQKRSESWRGFDVPFLFCYRSEMVEVNSERKLLIYIQRR